MRSNLCEMRPIIYFKLLFPAEVYFNLQQIYGHHEQFKLKNSEQRM